MILSFLTFSHWLCGRHPLRCPEAGDRQSHCGTTLQPGESQSCMSVSSHVSVSQLLYIFSGLTACLSLFQFVSLCISVFHGVCPCISVSTFFWLRGWGLAGSERSCCVFVCELVRICSEISLSFSHPLSVFLVQVVLALILCSNICPW